MPSPRLIRIKPRKERDQPTEGAATADPKKPSSAVGGQPDSDSAWSQRPFSPGSLPRMATLSPDSNTEPSAQPSAKRPGEAKEKGKKGEKRQRKRVNPPQKTSPRSRPRPQRSSLNPGGGGGGIRRKTTAHSFTCPFDRYGCTSRFPSKNEWKRHVSSQHIQLGFYRCDTGRCLLNNPIGYEGSGNAELSLVNDFNRPDLFLQHQRRMHAPWVLQRRKGPASDEEKKEFESTLEEVRKRCWHQQRVPPTKGICGFCNREFTGIDSWKEKMEHVARHFETGDLGPEREDTALRDWALEHRVIRWDGGRLLLASLCGKTDLQKPGVKYALPERATEAQKVPAKDTTRADSRNGPSIDRTGWQQNSQPKAPTDSGYSTGHPILPKPTLVDRGNDGERAANDRINTVRSTHMENGHSVGNATETGSLAPATTSSSINLGYISRFSNSLLERVLSGRDRVTDPEKALVRVADLVKDFADKVGYNTLSQPQLDIRFYFYKHRRDIAAYIKDICLNAKTGTIDVDKMSPGDRIPPWLAGLEAARNRKARLVGDSDTNKSDHEEEGELDDMSEEENDRTLPPPIQMYQELISGTAAYEWLIEALRKEICMDLPGTQGMNDIFNAVTEGFPNPPRISRKRGPEPVKATIVIPWNPLSFFKEQEYKESPATTFDKVITLTGSLDDAQAMTCVEYLRQTWPLTGDRIVNAMKGALHQGNNGEFKCTLPGDTDIIIRIDKTHLIVVAIGTRASVAEVAEQFAWLGASMRASSNDLRIASCRPFVKDKYLTPTESFMGPAMPNLQCHIDFAIQECDKTTEVGGARCWHNVFRNPVVVEGYPIRQRSQPNTGLEASLDILASLVPSYRVSTFGGKVFIKGFATILVPTKAVEDMIIWHAVFNKDGSHVSYTDPRIDNMPGLYPANISDGKLDSFRHVLGWCPDVEELTGSPKAQYDIQWSKVDKANEDCEFFNVSLSPGRFIKNSRRLALGKKDVAIHTVQRDYFEQIRWISKRYVVLYDAPMKRAWLVDGASALLHLVRASLKANEVNNSDKLIYRPDHLDEVYPTSVGRAAARKTLTNPKNLSVKIFANGDQNIGHRVDQIYHILEQIFSHQDRPTRDQSKAASKQPDRQRLEGFEFMDLATNRNHISPRVYADDSHTPSWLSFTAQIGAITLFGENFGDLIVPKDGHDLCDGWSTVPQGANHLTISSSDMKELMKKQGSLREFPWKVAEDVYWSPDATIFAPCECGSKSKTKCNRAQAFLRDPTTSTGSSTTDNLKELAAGGAIVFQEKWGEEILVDDSDRAPNKQQPNFRRYMTRARSLNDSAANAANAANTSKTSEAQPAQPARGGTKSRTRQKPPVRNEAEESSPKRVCRRASSPESRSPETPSVAVEIPAKPPSDPPTKSTIPDRPIPEDPSPMEIDTPKVENRQPQPGPSAESHETSEKDYTVGWICALPVELAAAQRMLDKVHQTGYGQGTDNNLYVLGQIRHLNVVVTCLPMGQYETGTATMVAKRMMNKFPKIEIGLMVGIGGGLPSPRNDVRLGDVVVSKPHMQHGGVFQYDMGKVTRSGFTTTASLHAPPEKLRLAMNLMGASGTSLRGEVMVPYPGTDLDRLYDSSYQHVDDDPSCESCDTKKLAQWRGDRPDTRPRIFYGIIASGKSVIKDASTRDTLMKKHQVLCCEMEAAGLMNTGFPCLVVRGISDYADSHKNDTWVEYAAAAAAQYAKDLLISIPRRLAFSQASP